MTAQAVAKTDNGAQDALMPADPYVSMIERVAMDPNADLEKLERMMQMRDQHEAREAERAFAAAFAAASAEIPPIPLNGRGHNNTKYALLKDIVALTRPVLSRHGLALNWDSSVAQNVVSVTAKLSHRLGHFQETSIQLPTDSSGSKNPVQSIGSSQTYGQRYTGQAILGLSLGEDAEDDGRATGKPIPQAPKHPSWAQTVVQDMPEGSSPRDKAEAIAEALCAQFKRKKSVQQVFNEWDRRAEIIEKMEADHADLHEKVVDAYELHIMELKGE